MVTTPFEFVVHIQCTNHSDIHIYQLCCQIEIALQVRGVNDIDDNVGSLFRQMLSHIEFFRRIARQRIGAWQVGQREVVTEELSLSHGGIDGHPAVVADVGMGARRIVEQRRLTAVGVAH